MINASVASMFKQRFREQPIASAGLLACVLGAAGCAVAAQYAMKLLIDALADQQRMLSMVWPALRRFLLLIGSESVMWRACGALTCRLTVEMGVRIRLDLMHSITDHSLEYFTESFAGSIGQRVTGTAGNAGALVNTVVWRIVPPVVDFIGALTIFTLIDWPMGAAIAAYVLGVGVTLLIVGAKGQAIHLAYFKNATRLAGAFVDVITNIWAVKAFSARDREVRRLAADCDQEATSQRNSWMYTERVRLAYDIVLWIMAAIMLTWSVHGWAAGHLSAGDVVVISALTFRLLHGSRDVALALVDAAQQWAYIADTFALLGRQESRARASVAKSLPKAHGGIVFRDVTFAFKGHDPLFDHFDLDIKAGERVGIVGASGSGKTTLLQLVQRQYHIQSGAISIGGASVSEDSAAELRQLMAVVPQEVTLFHRSILENIRFGRPDATDEAVTSAATAACCDDFVYALPDGLHSLVGERGLKLSGGQRQRVGIARAILLDAAYLLLDEATSALDTETELAVQRSLLGLSRGKTLIAVAHRLSTLAAFDRIIVLDRGRIVGEGTAHGLLTSNAWFRQMWRLQSEGLGQGG